jgi:hypothetical protein
MGVQMMTIPELVAQALGSFLTLETKGLFASSQARLTELLPFAAIRECEEHGWMTDRSDPHARERAFLVLGRTRLPASFRTRAAKRAHSARLQEQRPR